MILQYKNLYAHIRYSPITRTYYGELSVNEHLIVFQTSCKEDLGATMQSAVDEYLKSTVVYLH